MIFGSKKYSVRFQKQRRQQAIMIYESAFLFYYSISSPLQEYFDGYRVT